MNEADRRRWTLVVASAATALLLLDVTIVNVALPTIAADLDASFDELQWVVDSYALALAGTLLALGSLADRIGRRRVFEAGLVAFGVASVGCGAAGSGPVLDLARAVQGIGAAAMFSTALALLAEAFRGADRGKALGTWGAITGAALAIGPLVGGILVDTIGWRWIFWLNVPATVALLLLTRTKLAESRDPAVRRTDWIGSLLFTAGTSLLVFALIRGNADGWGSAVIVGALAAGAVSLAAFVAQEARTSDPVLDLSLFAIPSFSGTAIVAFAQALALYPMLLLVSVWMQGVLDLSPLETGLRVLPATLALLVVAPFSGRLAARVRLGVLLAAGLTTIGTSMLLLRMIEAGSTWTAILPGLVVGGIGVGIISPPLAAAMVGVLSEEKAGMASGVNNTFRQLGIAVGIALLGAILESHVDLAAPDAAGFAEGLDAAFLVAGLVAFAAVPAAWFLVRITPARPPGS